MRDSRKGGVEQGAKARLGHLGWTVAAGALMLALTAAGLSMLWFNRIV